MPRQSKDTTQRDYAASGLDIQSAMVDYIRSTPVDPTAPKAPRSILWSGVRLWTAFEIHVPRQGRFRIEFLSPPRSPVQGVDVKALKGSIALPGGEAVPLLRTWHEPQLEMAVEYPYRSSSGTLHIWNVYHRHWPDGTVEEEKWVGNAGMRVEDEEAGRRWLFHCSDGPSDPPNFDQLVFRITILGK